MKIFIGSSKESASVMDRISTWLHPHEIIRWNKQGAFQPTGNVFDELIRHTWDVDGAILIFGEDDLTISREIIFPTTRDNVWFEFGLFVGALGRDRVLPINVGDPKCATDVLGNIHVSLPTAKEEKNEAEEQNRERWQSAQQNVGNWLRGLSPAYFRNFTFDVIMRLSPRTQLDVETILTISAPEFMSESVKQIRAVCSNKGKFAKDYYGKQFEWAKKPSSERKLRRVFVAKKEGDHAVFSEDEEKGIRMHLENECPAIQAKWVYQHEKQLGASYQESLGFALFDGRWILHWGLESGFCYQDSSDDQLGAYLIDHFERLWKSAHPFAGSMRSRLLGDSRQENQ